MTEADWKTVDEEIFAAVTLLKRLPESDRRYRECKDRFGRLFVKKLGAWLAVQFGRALWAKGIEAEDVLHEVYLRIHDRLFNRGEVSSASFDDPQKLKNYLFTVAQKTAVTVLTERFEIPPAHCVPPPESSPDLQWIWKYLPFLDPHDRPPAPRLSAQTEFKEQEQQALFFWYVDRLSHREIGERLGTSADGAKQLIYRTKLKLLASVPWYAAHECVSVLSPAVPDWLQNHGEEPLRELAAMDRSSLSTLRRATGILQLGIEQDRKKTFGARAQKVLRQKVGDALKGCGASRQSTKSPSAAEVADLLLRALSYLGLQTLRKVPRQWLKDEADREAEVQPLRSEDTETLTLLFFCLCSILAERPELKARLAESARKVLAGAWPLPPVPSPEWSADMAEAMDQLEAMLGSESAGPPARRGEPRDTVPPEECLLQALIYEADQSARDAVDGRLGRGPIADWLRRLQPPEEASHGDDLAPSEANRRNGDQDGNAERE